MEKLTNASFSLRLLFGRGYLDWAGNDWDEIIPRRPAALLDLLDRVYFAHVEIVLNGPVMAFVPRRNNQWSLWKMAIRPTLEDVEKALRKAAASIAVPLTYRGECQLMADTVKRGRLLIHAHMINGSFSKELEHIAGSKPEKSGPDVA